MYVCVYVFTYVSFCMFGNFLAKNITDYILFLNAITHSCFQNISNEHECMILVCVVIVFLRLLYLSLLELQKICLKTEKYFV